MNNLKLRTPIEKPILSPVTIDIAKDKLENLEKYRCVVISIDDETPIPYYDEAIVELTYHKDGEVFTDKNDNDWSIDEILYVYLPAPQHTVVTDMEPFRLILDEIKQMIDGAEIQDTPTLKYLWNVLSNVITGQEDSLLSAQPTVTDEQLKQKVNQLVSSVDFISGSGNERSELIYSLLSHVPLSAQGEEKKAEPDGWVHQNRGFFTKKEIEEEPESFKVNMKPVYFSPPSAPSQKKPLEETGWISVEDRLPEIQKRVLLWYAKTCWTEGWLSFITEDLVSNSDGFEMRKTLGWSIGNQTRNGGPDVTHCKEISAPTATGKEGKDA